MFRLPSHRRTIRLCSRVCTTAMPGWKVLGLLISSYIFEIPEIQYNTFKKPIQRSLLLPRNPIRRIASWREPFSAAHLSPSEGRHQRNAIRSALSAAGSATGLDRRHPASGGRRGLPAAERVHTANAGRIDGRTASVGVHSRRRFSLWLSQSIWCKAATSAPTPK